MRIIRFSSMLIKEAKTIFPRDIELHEMMRIGDRKALDYVQIRVGFTVDEDDIIRAFRNKNEHNLLDIARRSKAIRDLYQKIFFLIDEQDDKAAEKLSHMDCI